MGGINGSLRRELAKVCDEEQSQLFEKAGFTWSTRMCEVTVARVMSDNEFLDQKWCIGDCRGDILLDHIDNNSDNNPTDGSNNQWLCRSHNLKKNPLSNTKSRHKFNISNKSEHSHERDRDRERERFKSRRQRNEIEYVNDSNELTVKTVEMASALRFNKTFEKTAKKIMKRLEVANFSDIVESVANEVGCSIQTGERRLKLLSAKYSVSAPFEREILEGGRKILRWKRKKNNGVTDPEYQKEEQV